MPQTRFALHSISLIFLDSFVLFKFSSNIGVGVSQWGVQVVLNIKTLFRLIVLSVITISKAYTQNYALLAHRFLLRLKHIYFFNMT